MSSGVSMRVKSRAASRANRACNIGAAAGVSGPAVYRHFASKQAVLGAVLLEVSHDLLERGR